MIAVLESSCPLSQKAEVVRLLESAGLRVQVTETDDQSFIGAVGDSTAELVARLEAMPGVKEVRPVAPPYPLTSRETRPERTRVKVGPVYIGQDNFTVIAGPCSVEGEEQLLATAKAAKAAGAALLRGGAFKPRSSPYSFQGLGEAGLELLALAREETGLGVVTEVVAPEEVELVARYADVLQIGARNMQNFRLLSAAGEQPKPVLLKRGIMATVEELLLAAEYVASAGNPRVVLCERGIRTFETATRATLDIGAVPVLREKTHLPVIVDPSHAAGKRELVPALSRAAVAAGADGLIIEIHPDPTHARSDGRQSMKLEAFGELMRDLKSLALVMGRTV
ncbi:MAG: 3-deoxy-7-phosphoheptulonate synthase [Gemmatimonadales bacterium]